MSAVAPSSPNPRVWRVGMTGGIASGKTTVSGMFAALGVPIIDADVIAREVAAPGTELVERIFERFGTDLRLPDGSLDRAALRRRVFADAAARLELEALLHPAIRARAEKLAAQALGPYVMHVIPLLVETASAPRFDRVLVVDCPEAVQLERLQSRDGSDSQQARAILATQASRAQRLAVADDLIVNDGKLETLQSAVASLHQKYQRLAAAARNQPPP
jgi:dephospho-CoA kinase